MMDRPPCPLVCGDSEGRMDRASHTRGKDLRQWRTKIGEGGSPGQPYFPPVEPLGRMTPYRLRVKGGSGVSKGRRGGKGGSAPRRKVFAARTWRPPRSFFLRGGCRETTWATARCLRKVAGNVNVRIDAHDDPCDPGADPAVFSAGSVSGSNQTARGTTHKKIDFIHKILVLFQIFAKILTLLLKTASASKPGAYGTAPGLFFFSRKISFL